MSTTTGTSRGSGTTTSGTTVGASGVRRAIDEPAGAGYRTAQRVVLPVDGDLDVLPLYLDFRGSDSTADDIHPDDVTGRRSVRVRPGERLSFGSYFNAFPASYWRRWTVVETVRLQVVTTGEGNVIVYKSNARGNRQRVESYRVEGSATTVVDLPLATFGDGGFYWFDLVAGEQGLSLQSAQWSVPEAGRPYGTASLGVTTYNKADYCLRTMAAVAADADLREVLDEMMIVDQGTQKVSAEPGFAQVAADLGDQLRIIEQPNMGGSGGFARNQYEATMRERSDYVILMDDDIALEAESIVRLVTFADMCRKPTLVGGHMFDLLNRGTLHTYGEIVDPWNWQPALPGADQYLGHDFTRTGLRDAAWMHQRVDVDYNGWWMCLIPTSVIREIGLSLPIFIKWDDAEYGLRAKAAGYHTVSLPGAAVWHVSWVDKDDLVGWQGYFHERNRLMTALIHSRFPRGGNVLRGSEMGDLKHLVSMQYYTMTGRLRAQEDLLAGPDQLHSILASRAAEVRADAKNHDDARLKPEIDDYPQVREPKPRRPRRHTGHPGARRVAIEGAKAVARQLRPMREGAYDNPQTLVSHKDNKWWNVAQHDSALVTNAEGTGIAWYRRRPEVMRSMLARSAANHARMLAEWPTLATTYREALPRITSFEAWEQTFGITDANRPGPRGERTE